MRRSLLQSYLEQRRRGENEITIEERVEALLKAAEGDDSRLRQIINQRKELRERRERERERER